MQVVNPTVVSSSSIPDGSNSSVTLLMLRASVVAGQQLQRATFALARVGTVASPWRLLTHDFIAVAPDPLRLPVNVLPIQVCRVLLFVAVMSMNLQHSLRPLAAPSPFYESVRYLARP
jgi:hypothetical protein